MTAIIPIAQKQSWQQQLSNMITSAEELLNLLGLTPEQVGYAEPAAESFGVRVPRAFAARMQHNRPDDPLLQQVLPIQAELIAAAGYSADPLQETTSSSNPLPGVIHKYRSRVLLLSAGSCAVHCRYCFRRHFPYTDNQNSRSQWQQALTYIKNKPQINEVILSGGDPLMSSDRFLDELVSNIAAIPSIKRLRLHTRLPVVIPDRITDQLVNALQRENLKTLVVIHANHAQEIGPELSAAMATLKQAGFTLLNQSVLLAGVNDTSDALAELSESLFDAHVLPYYLHLLDKVDGAQHFHISDRKALQLHHQMAAKLPGFLLPKLVRETAGGQAKEAVLQSETPP